MPVTTQLQIVHHAVAMRRHTGGLTMIRILAGLLMALGLHAQQSGLNFLNGNRPVLDAHNCYPYDGKWTDRIDRALKTGFPVGIEQDLAWNVDPVTRQGRLVVSHAAEDHGARTHASRTLFRTGTADCGGGAEEERPRALAVDRAAFRFQGQPGAAAPRGLGPAWRVSGLDHYAPQTRTRTIWRLSTRSPCWC